MIYRGIKKFLPVEDKKVLCVDIGGGSTEILLGNKGKSRFAVSIKIGSVRLSKKFFPDYKLSQKSIQECESYIENEILQFEELHKKWNFDFAVGTSGTVFAIASLIHSINYSTAFKKIKGFSFNSEQLNQVYDLILNAKTREDRLRINGMDSKRADIIPAGVMILKKVFDFFNIKGMQISDYALREGIILETIQEMKQNK